jgi:hypothetical protein
MTIFSQSESKTLHVKDKFYDKILTYLDEFLRI